MTGPLPDWAKEALVGAGFCRSELDAEIPPLTEQELADYLAGDCPRCEGTGGIIDLPVGGRPIATSPDRDCSMCKGSGRVAW